MGVREYLKNTLKPIYLASAHVFKRRFTVKYPYVALKPTERTIGRHIYYPDKCKECGVCGRFCPNQCIDQVEYEYQGRIMKGIRIDYGLCMFCNNCVFYCPTGALGISSAYVILSYDREKLIFGPQQLSELPKSEEGKKVSVKFYEEGGLSHK